MKAVLSKPAVAITRAACCVNPRGAQRLFSDKHVDQMAVEQRVINIVQHFRNVKAPAVTSKSKFLDLGLDSLDTIELIAAVEREFHLSIPTDKADNMAAVHDVVKFVSAHNR
jgi:acyl carrier protein